MVSTNSSIATYSRVNCLVISNWNFRLKKNDLSFTNRQTFSSRVKLSTDDYDCAMRYVCVIAALHHTNACRLDQERGLVWVFTKLAGRWYQPSSPCHVPRTTLKKTGKLCRRPSQQTDNVAQCWKFKVSTNKEEKYEFKKETSQEFVLDKVWLRGRTRNLATFPSVTEKGGKFAVWRARLSATGRLFLRLDLRPGDDRDTAFDFQRWIMEWRIVKLRITNPDYFSFSRVFLIRL